MPSHEGLSSIVLKFFRASSERSGVWTWKSTMFGVRYWQKSFIDWGMLTLSSFHSFTCHLAWMERAYLPAAVNCRRASCGLPEVDTSGPTYAPKLRLHHPLRASNAPLTPCAQLCTTNNHRIGTLGKRTNDKIGHWKLSSRGRYAPDQASIYNDRPSTPKNLKFDVICTLIG